MADHRVIHLTQTRKALSGIFVDFTRQGTLYSHIFGSNPSISHEPWRLPEVCGWCFLLLAKSRVKRLFE